MNKSVLSFARNASFIRSFLFLSLLLFCSFSFAEGFVIDNRTGKIIPGSNRWPTNGLKTVYSPNHGFYQTYSKAADLTTVRDTMRGVRSAGGVPATISRTASLAKVAQNIHGKLRFARFTPQGLIGSLILGEILQHLIDEGYTYDESTGEMVRDGRTVVCFVHFGECFDHKTKSVLNNQYAVFDRVFGNPTQQQLEALCNTVQVDNINFTVPLTLLSTELVGNTCHVKAVTQRRADHIASGTRYTFHLNLRVLPAVIGSLSASEFQRILEPIAAQNPEAVLQAADLSDSDWSAPKVHVLPGTIVNSQPFTDPKDGKAKQARWEFYDCGQNESCVRETLIDRPDLQPNSPAAPTPDNPPASGSGTDTALGTGNQTGTEQPPPFDLCKEHPEILACQQMGQPDPGQFDDIRIPVHVDNTTWQEDLFLPSTGVCPAPKTFHVMGKPVSVSYQPLCSFMETIRFIVLICFIVSAAYISFGGLKQG